MNQQEIASDARVAGNRHHPAAAVRTIMSRPVATIAADATVLDAVKEMDANQIGLVVVTDGDRRAMLSERDVIACLAAGVDIGVTAVRDAASFDLIWIEPSDPVDSAAAAMVGADVRHLPVGDGRHIVGVVAMRDVLAELLTDQDSAGVVERERPRR